MFYRALTAIKLNYLTSNQILIYIILYYIILYYIHIILLTSLNNTYTYILSQLAFTCSTIETIETLEKGVKFV